jgi:hypothetical protein
MCGAFAALCPEKWDFQCNRVRACRSSFFHAGIPDVGFPGNDDLAPRGRSGESAAGSDPRKDPLTRRLAEEIIASQTVEIRAMRQRLAILRDADDPNPGAFPTLHGTRGTAPRE